MFTFSFDAELRDQKLRTLVFHVSSTDNLTDIKDNIQGALKQNLCPEFCVLLASWECKKYLDDLLSDQEMVEVWARWLPVGLEDRYCGILVEKTRSLSVKGFSLSKVETESLWNQIGRKGSAHLLEANGGVVRAGPMWHYIKPSGKHTSIFIRTANVLIDGSDIDFIALLLYRLSPDEISTIYCDTSGIHALAFSLKRLLESAKPKHRSVGVKSFRSYHGYIDTRMDDIATSMILVSASFSGDLHNLLVKKKRADAGRIVTIYFAGPPLEEGPMKALCCIRRDSNFADTLLADDENPHSGKFVKSGSMGLQIKGDSFLAEPSEVKAHLITASDCPAWLRDFQELFCGVKALRSLWRAPTSDRTHENWICLETAFRRSRKYNEKIQDFFCNNLPVKTSQVIISLSSTEALYASIKRIVRGFYRTASFAGFDGHELSMLSGEDSTSPVVVVVPVVRSGQRILALSRALRDRIGDRSIHYVVLTSLCDSQRIWSDLVANISYGPKGKDSHQVVTMLTGYMPAAGITTAWDSEYQWIAGLDSSCHLRKQLNPRFCLLTGDRSCLGPKKALFLKNNSASPLTLRKGFVFDRRNTNASVAGLTQDELYFSVSAILHNLRRVKTTGPFREDISRHSVLDAANFDRYNDAAIQAAILRAALQRELDYNGSKEQSDRLMSILRFELGSSSRPASEAAAELLLAKLSGRLRLHAEVLPAFIELVRSAKQRQPKSLLAQICQALAP
jgi:hypothetical protein